MKADHYLENQMSGAEGTPDKTRNFRIGTAAQRAAMEIRGLMGARKLNTSDLAQLLNVSRDTAARRMAGDNYLSINDLETIADWLGVSVCRIIAPAPGATYSE